MPTRRPDRSAATRAPHPGAPASRHRAMARQPYSSRRLRMRSRRHEPRHTAPRSTSPWNSGCHSGSTLKTNSRSPIVRNMSAPKIAPIALPDPPNRDTPPSTTAAIEYSVYVLPPAADASPEYVTNVTNNPAIDARRPDSVYATSLARRIGTPDMYAATSAEPTAYTARPTTERRNGHHTIATTAVSNTRLEGTMPAMRPVTASASVLSTSPPGTGRRASAMP